ncbi:MAG: NAD(P)H-dependent oxidoreductase [Rariglobus sp.]
MSASSRAPRRRPHLVLINASLAGATGNTAAAFTVIRKHLARRARVTVLTLAGNAPHGTALRFADIQATLATADGFLFGTGNHWDSWSSVLQTLLEDATLSEGSKLWLGKPAAVVVTEHSVGGKGVLSRLQGVLVTFGCAIPPMSGLVISKSTQIAAHHDADAANDFWTASDLPIVCHNLIEAAAGTHRWRAWSVDREDFSKRWIDVP